MRCIVYMVLDLYGEADCENGGGTEQYEGIEILYDAIFMMAAKCHYLD